MDIFSEYLKEGIKKYELRLCRALSKKIKRGDIFRYCDEDEGELLYYKVVGVKYYKYAKSIVKSYAPSEFGFECEDEDEYYEAFANDEDDIDEFGLALFEIKKVSKITDLFFKLKNKLIMLIHSIKEKINEKNLLLSIFWNNLLIFDLFYDTMYTVIL